MEILRSAKQMYAHHLLEKRCIFMRIKFSTLCPIKIKGIHEIKVALIGSCLSSFCCL
jgi:hypothetical protein